MAKNNKIIFSYLLLVLIFGNKNGVLKLQGYNKILEKETRNMNNAKQNNNLHGDEFPAVRVAANDNFILNLPPPPPRHADDFRPTAPGHSRGIGHSLQN
ncbi:hypothetical protein ACOSQ2_023422 [Xanthoceras sorbifolium]